MIEEVDVILHALGIDGLNEQVRVGQ